MRVAILSDSHLGFGHGSERYDDPFNAFSEALEKAKGCDLVLIAGDIFDNKNPTTETLSNAMEALLGLRFSGNGATLATTIGRDIATLSPASTMGLPILALHGNHERRAKGLVNPVHALEKAGLLIHLHCNGIVFKRGDECIAVQGMSSVPEQYAEETMKQWNPKPVPGALNILMVHQIFSELYQTPESIPVSMLPRGFDVYVDGDVHKPMRAECNGKPFIVAGSLVPTQQTKDETEPKGIWILDTGMGEIQFLPLEDQRRFYFLEYPEPDRQAMERDIEHILTKPHEKKPAIRIKTGHAFEWSSDLEMKYSANALLSFRSGESKRLEGVSLIEHIASVEETAAKLLHANLEKAGLPQKAMEHAFELLAEGRGDDALKAVIEAVKVSKKNPRNDANALGQPDAFSPSV